MHANEYYGQKQMLENCELYIYASHWCQRLFYFNILHGSFSACQRTPYSECPY